MGRIPDHHRDRITLTGGGIRASAEGGRIENLGPDPQYHHPPFSGDHRPEKRSREEAQPLIFSMATKISAGLLVFRRTTSDVEVLLAHPGGPFFKNKDDGVWTVPK